MHEANKRTADIFKTFKPGKVHESTKTSKRVQIPNRIQGRERLIPSMRTADGLVEYNLN